MLKQVLTIAFKDVRSEMRGKAQRECNCAQHKTFGKNRHTDLYRWGGPIPEEPGKRGAIRHPRLHRRASRH